MCNSLLFRVYWELCFSLEESTLSAVYSTDVKYTFCQPMISGHSIYCWRKVKPLLCLHYKKRGFLCSLIHIHWHTHPFWNFPALIISICLKLYETARSCWFEQNVKASFFFFLFSPPSLCLSDSYYAMLHAPPTLTLRTKTQSLIQMKKSAEKPANCSIKGLWPLLANAVDATVCLFHLQCHNE